MADLATLRTRLAEAEAARHKLMTGARVVAVTTSMGTVQYTQASGWEQLNNYIAELRGDIRRLEGASLGPIVVTPL